MKRKRTSRNLSNKQLAQREQWLENRILVAIDRMRQSIKTGSRKGANRAFNELEMLRRKMGGILATQDERQVKTLVKQSITNK